MECIFLKSAQYLADYKVILTFSTGEEGVVDLKELIFSSPAAAPLRDKEAFSKCYLDEWPTLAWECGFDVAPESLYERADKSNSLELVAMEDPDDYSTDVSLSSCKFKYLDIEMAYMFANSGSYGENTVIVCKDTGKILNRSDFSGEDEIGEAEEDGTLNWDEAVEVPHKNDLDLGRDLVYEFVNKELPNEYDRVRDIFRRKGAYSRYKDFLDQRDKLDQWYEFENSREKETLRQWCKENGIQLED